MTFKNITAIKLAIKHASSAKYIVPKTLQNNPPPKTITFFEIDRNDLTINF